MNLGISKLFKFFVIFLLLENLNAKTEELDFDFIKKGKQDQNTLLLIGGIQGDEPGAFTAASLFATHYEITKGSVWVVPNLNFYSIIKRSRGPYGDMNRKFAKISKDDPDYKTVQRIKSYIKEDNVKMIVHLHDGSGFYRKEKIDDMYSPKRWGNCSVIDQSIVKTKKYGNLEEISTKVVESINEKLIIERDRYHVRNTFTDKGDQEMAKALTYFAIKNGKAAFANEASKELPVEQRVYYHLLAIEEYMKIMGIEFNRKFELNPIAIRDVIENDIYITFYDEKIILPLSKVRSLLKYFPVNKDGSLDFRASSPIMTIVKEKNNDYIIHYGNKQLSTIKPDFIKFIDDERDIKVEIDGKPQILKFGDIVYGKDSFKVEKMKDLRANIIGYTSKEKDEAGIVIKKDDILKNYSIDKDGVIFRVEFYKGKDFAGMILLGFEE